MDTSVWVLAPVSVLQSVEGCPLLLWCLLDWIEVWVIRDVMYDARVPPGEYSMTTTMKLRVSKIV